MLYTTIGYLTALAGVVGPRFHRQVRQSIHDDGGVARRVVQPADVATALRLGVRWRGDERADLQSRVFAAFAPPTELSFLSSYCERRREHHQKWAI